MAIATDMMERDDIQAVSEIAAASIHFVFLKLDWKTCVV
ncbi:MAG: hypothetical protein K0Q87_2890 [Neobacillus sp.]|jgi:hypothetical protein|nr:hypothetical protein [Neobacillus sp.]